MADLYLYWQNGLGNVVFAGESLLNVSGQIYTNEGDVGVDYQGSMVIDWGDGTQDPGVQYTAYPGNQNYFTFPNHAYPQTGTYAISLTATGTSATYPSVNGSHSITVQLQVVEEAAYAYPDNPIVLPQDEAGSFYVDLKGCRSLGDLSFDGLWPFGGIYGDPWPVLNFEFDVTIESSDKIAFLQWTSPIDGMLDVTLTSTSLNNYTTGLFIDASNFELIQSFGFGTALPYEMSRTFVPVTYGATYFIVVGVEINAYEIGLLHLEWKQLERNISGPVLFLDNGFQTNFSAFVVSLDEARIEPYAAFGNYESYYPYHSATDGKATLWSRTEDHDESGANWARTIVDQNWVAPRPSVYKKQQKLGSEAAWLPDRQSFLSWHGPFDEAHVEIPFTPPGSTTWGHADYILSPRWTLFYSCDLDGNLDNYWFMDYWATDYPQPRPQMPAGVYRGQSTYPEFQHSGIFVNGNHVWLTAFHHVVDYNYSAESGYSITIESYQVFVKLELDDATHTASEIFRFDPTPYCENIATTTSDNTRRVYSDITYILSPDESKLVVLYRKGWPPGYTEPGNLHQFNNWYIGGIWAQVWDMPSILNGTPKKLDEWRFVPYPTIAGSYASQDDYDDYNFYLYQNGVIHPEDPDYIYMVNNGYNTVTGERPIFVFRLPLIGKEEEREQAMAKPWATHAGDGGETYAIHPGHLSPITGMGLGDSGVRVRFS